MTGRHFPDNQEVDEWISTHFLSEADADASPVVDQLKAATAEAVTRFQAAAPGMVASGLGRWAALNIPDHDRSRIRGAVRMVIAAESAGLLPLCQHVNQIQPLIMVCDPPVMICTSCFASRQTVIESATGVHVAEAVHDERQHRARRLRPEAR
jgi:hypothetical protein